MANKTINVSMPENMAHYVEHAVKSGEYASISDFIRITIREHQQRDVENWADNLLRERMATAHIEDNLIDQEDFEREILGRNVADPSR
jgi:putative addiction module CopG family antidote